MVKPANTKRMSKNELIGHLMDRPELYVVRTNTKRGTLWTTNTLAILNEFACEWLIGRRILVERDRAMSGVDAAALSYELSPEFRQREEARLSGKVH